MWEAEAEEKSRRDDAMAALREEERTSLDINKSEVWDNGEWEGMFVSVEFVREGKEEEEEEDEIGEEEVGEDESKEEERESWQKGECEGGRERGCNVSMEFPSASFSLSHSIVSLSPPLLTPNSSREFLSLSLSSAMARTYDIIVCTEPSGHSHVLFLHPAKLEIENSAKSKKEEN